MTSETWKSNTEKVKKKLYKYFIKVNVKQCLIYVFNSFRIAEVYTICIITAKT